ncbi:hypothetical protein QBC37DRAFT_431770 [Rhypophila decipiens]|uniref:Uncharacterized protein n=1 Tax=Rhypophila decipiens TaxID=261697 RepID=A0AAN6XXN3_9PEZI|nr:hypothetical protein QBC37DRAFT_431770 [Rhypophila decipiens]
MASGAFRTTLRRLAAVSHQSPVVKSTASSSLSKTVSNKIIPGVVVFGSVFGVVSYVRSQLRQESETMNRMFAKQYSPEVMEARRRNYLIDQEGDPRKSIYNVLNWGRS